MSDFNLKQGYRHEQTTPVPLPDAVRRIEPAPIAADEHVPGSGQLAPLEKSGVAQRFEPGPALDIPLMIEVVVYRRMD
jgi:hypothetical protein